MFHEKCGVRTNCGSLHSCLRLSINYIAVARSQLLTQLRLPHSRTCCIDCSNNFKPLVPVAPAWHTTGNRCHHCCHHCHHQPAYAVNLRNRMQELWPPNPKELDSATSMSCFCFSAPTKMLRSTSSSGSSRFKLGCKKPAPEGTQYSKSLQSNFNTLSTQSQYDMPAKLHLTAHAWKHPNLQACCTRANNTASRLCVLVPLRLSPRCCCRELTGSQCAL